MQIPTKLYAASSLKNRARKNRMRYSSSVRGGTQSPLSENKQINNRILMKNKIIKKDRCLYRKSSLLALECRRKLVQDLHLAFEQCPSLHWGDRVQDQYYATL